MKVNVLKKQARMIIRFLLMVILCVSIKFVYGESSAAIDPGTWTQWRGAKRNSIVTGLPWPSKIDNNHLKQMWRKEIGEGYPGPIVSTNLVFTVETLDKKQEVVRAFDRFLGKQVWETSWGGSMRVPFFSAKNGSWVRSTPAFDGQNLYVAGMQDLLVCLNAEDGSIKWQVDFAKRFETPLPKFGFVCSPLVDKEGVYVQAGASFVKLNKHTGATLWRTLKDSGGMYGGAFSSPIKQKICGVEQLIVQTRGMLAGVDPANGTVLWKQKVKAFRGMNIQTPVVVGNTLFTSCYDGASILFDLKKEGDVFTISEVWRDKKSQAYMSTPVVIDGNIYFHRRDQRFSCLNPETKTILWKSPVYGQYCSLIANGTRILGLNQKGDLLLIDASPESFNLLDRRKISKQSTWGHIAVAGDQVFIRELKAIAVYRWSNAAEELPDPVSADSVK